MFRLQTALTKEFYTSEVIPRKMTAGSNETFVVLTAGGRRAQGWVHLKIGDDLVSSSPVLLANPEVDTALEIRREKAIRLSTLLPPTREEMLWHGVFELADRFQKKLLHALPIHLVEGSHRLAEETQVRAHFLQTLGFLPDQRKARGADGRPLFIFERWPKSQITPDSLLEKSHLS